MAGGWCLDMSSLRGIPAVSDLLIGKRRGCTGSTVRQTPPSYGRSSELHLAIGNSTGTACSGEGEELHCVCDRGWWSAHGTVKRSADRRAWTRLRSANSCSSTKACSTLMLKSSLLEGEEELSKSFPILFHLQPFLVLRASRPSGRSKKTPRRRLKPALNTTWTQKKHFSTWIPLRQDSRHVCAPIHSGRWSGLEAI